jgi:hypothetical protein
MFIGLFDIHKLCTSDFKPRNVFSVINIGTKEHKKPRNEEYKKPMNKCLFHVVCEHF